jgi:putative ABC transport system permease protein
MKTLFGISMDTIMAVSLGLFLATTLLLAVLALRNRLMLALGLRNIPRRRAQTALIVIGLMLSTVIITSAFGTGDTMSYSIRTLAVANLGPIDEAVSSAAQANSDITTGNGGGMAYISAATADRVGAGLAAGHLADGVAGVIAQSIPVQDLTSRQTKANATILGLPPAPDAGFGALHTDGGTEVLPGDLAPNEVSTTAPVTISARGVATT